MEWVKILVYEKINRGKRWEQSFFIFLWPPTSLSISLSFSLSPLFSLSLYCAIPVLFRPTKTRWVRLKQEREKARTEYFRSFTAPSVPRQMFVQRAVHCFLPWRSRRTLKMRDVGALTANDRSIVSADTRLLSPSWSHAPVISLRPFNPYQPRQMEVCARKWLLAW